MKKITSLIFSVFFTLVLFAQANGGWGICEFTTIAALNAFDPSSSNLFCKRAFVQANNRHYLWDGSSWTEDTGGGGSGGSNIYDSSGTLTGDRVVDGNSNSLSFNDIFLYITSSVISIFSASISNYYQADSNGSGIGEHLFYTGSTEQMTIENSGTIDLLQYGDGTYEDNTDNTFDLGVDADGNVIEVDRRVSKIRTSSYSYSSDQDNLTLAGLTTAPYFEVYRINATDDFDLTGINSTGVKDGQRVTLLNISNNDKIKLKDQDGDSLARNRFIMPDGNDEDIKEGGSVTFIYDATSNRWRVYSIAGG